MAFEKIAKVLPAMKDHVKNGSTMEAVYVVEVAKMVFRNVYAEGLWDRVVVRFYRQGVLTLVVDSSVVAHAVKMGELRFLAALRGQVKGVEVRRVVCRVGEG